MFSAPTWVADFDVGTVQRADGQAPLSASFMLPDAGRPPCRRSKSARQIGRGYDDFREADIVVGKEHDLQPSGDIGSLLTISATSLISLMISLAVR